MMSTTATEQNSLLDQSSKQSDDHITESSNEPTNQSSQNNESNPSSKSNDQPQMTKHRKHKSKQSVHFDDKHLHEIINNQSLDQSTNHSSIQSIDQSMNQLVETEETTNDNSDIDHSSNNASALRQRKNKPKRSSDHVPFSHSSFKRPMNSNYGNPNNHYQSANQSPVNQHKVRFVHSPLPFTAEEIAQQKARRQSWLKQTEIQLAVVHQNAQAIKAREGRMQLIGLIVIWLLVVCVMFWFVYRSMNQVPGRPTKRLINQSINPAFNPSQWWT